MGEPKPGPGKLTSCSQRPTSGPTLVVEYFAGPNSYEFSLLFKHSRDDDRKVANRHAGKQSVKQSSHDIQEAKGSGGPTVQPWSELHDEKHVSC